MPNSDTSSDIKDLLKKLGNNTVDILRKKYPKKIDLNSFIDNQPDKEITIG
jgi:hypothetical protein